MALVFDLKVVPKSGRNEWTNDTTNKIKCYLKSPPEKGLANKELVKSLAKILKFPQSDIEIIKGLSSRNKTNKIHTAITIDELRKKLKLDNQLSLMKK